MAMIIAAGFALILAGTVVEALRQWVGYREFQAQRRLLTHADRQA